MKNDSVKTISIYMTGSSKPKWIFDVSDKTAEKILNDLDSPSPLLTIANVPSKTGIMTLVINKNKINHVSVE